ncbi:MAG: hypothetical protein HY927_04690 [Elusimicrobia bacterium]|nr:hypothetical protein [Elusimicrobiota bacterium]
MNRPGYDERRTGDDVLPVWLQPAPSVARAAADGAGDARLLASSAPRPQAAPAPALVAAPAQARKTGLGADFLALALFLVGTASMVFVSIPMMERDLSARAAVPAAGVSESPAPMAPVSAEAQAAAQPGPETVVAQAAAAPVPGDSTVLLAQAPVVFVAPQIQPKPAPAPFDDGLVPYSPTASVEEAALPEEASLASVDPRPIPVEQRLAAVEQRLAAVERTKTSKVWRPTKHLKPIPWLSGFSRPVEEDADQAPARVASFDLSKSKCCRPGR